MNEIKLIVGLIVVIAWIVGNIRERQKAAAKKAPPPVANDAPPAAAPPRPNELDSYLEEVRRRMGEPEARKLDAPLPSLLAEEPRRAAPSRSQPPMKQKKKRQPDRPPTPTRHAEVTSLSPDMLKMPLTGSIGPAPSAAKNRPSPVVKDVVNLLKSPSGLSTAFLLREILSEPMCKRRPENRRKGL